MLEKKDHIRLKGETVEKLQCIDVSRFDLSSTDKRLGVYVRECIDNPEGHNLYELLAILRFFLFLDKYIFKPSEVKAFIYFYERLKFSGTKGRQRYKMTPVQVFQVACIFGFFKANGKRLCRDALLFVPRKFNKTGFAAAVATYDLLFGDANGQAYVGANSYDQAKICFNEIREILRSMDRRLRNFKINREIVFNKRPGKTSFARCLASSPDKLDGLNASTVIVDEYSQAESAELKNVLTSSMGVRENPVTIVITTASDKLESPFVDMLKSYKAVLRGELENDSVFAHLFEPDAGDEESDPATWKKVHPHLGITIQSDYYENEYRKALMGAEEMLTFRTKLLNIFVQNSAKTWITGEEIEALFRKIDMSKIEGRPPAMVAVDLSVRDDFSAVTYNIYSKNTRSFHSRTDYYFPAGALKDHRNRELYKKWADRGYLILCEGEIIDYELIANDILTADEYLQILGIGYDPYKSLEFVNLLSASGAGDVLTPVRQTYGAFTSPVESFEIAVKTKKQTFEPNPITVYCFNNAVIDEDWNENRKPIKMSAEKKIDGAITNVMTYYLFNNLER